MTAPGGGSGGHMDLTPLWLPLAIETRGVNKQLEQLGGRSGGGFSQAFQRATGKGMARGIEQASRQVGASMNTLADHVRRYDQASRKAADATGKHRVAQLALKQAQDSGKASALQLAQAEEREAKAKRDAKAATDSLTAAEKSLKEQHRQLNAEAGKGGGAFRSFFQGIKQGSHEAGAGVDAMGNKLSGMSLKGAAAGAALGTAIVGGVRLASQGITGMVRLADDAFKRVYYLGEQWDTVSDQIKVFTTTTGTAYEQLNRNAERVAERLPGSLDGLGQNLAVVHSRLGLTGKDLEDFTRQAMEAGRMLGEPLNLRKLTGSMKAFGVEGDEANAVLNDMFNIARRTGIPINDLISATQKGSVFLKRYGLGFSESAALLAQFDMVGVDTNRLVKSLGGAMEEFREQGKDPATGLKDTLATVEQLMAAGRNTDAVGGLQKLFGAGAGTQIFSLIETGALSLDTLQQGFVRTGETIDDMAAKTDDVPEKIGRMVNRVKVAARPLAEGLFGALGPQLDKAMGVIENHQDQLIQGFVTVGGYALGFTKTMAQGATGIMRVWALLAAAGSRTVGSLLKGLSSLTGYLGGLLDTLGMDALGQGLKDLSQAGSSMLAGFDKLPDTLNGAADALQHGFIDKVPGWEAGLQDFGDQLIEDTRLSKALGDSVLTGIPDSKEVKLEGNIPQVTEQFRKLGVEITTTPDGKIISVQAPTEEAAANVRDFIKSETGQELEVIVKPTNASGRPIKTLDDFLPTLFGGNTPGVDVPVNPVQGPTPGGWKGLGPPGPGAPGGAAPGGGGGGAAPPGSLESLFPSGSGGSGASINLQTAAANARGGGGNAEAWRPYVRQALAQYGPGLGIQNMQAWEDALVRQINTESGGDPGSINENDSNGRGGTQRVAGLLNFLDTTYAAHNITGLPYMDPYGQIAAALHYVRERWGVNPDGSPKQIGQGQGFQHGGQVGPGGIKLAEIIGSGSRAPGKWDPTGEQAPPHSGKHWRTGVHGWFGGSDVDMWIPGGHSQQSPRHSRHRGQYKLLGYQLGGQAGFHGPVPGVDLGRDSVHTVLQPKEFVVRQKQAQKWLPLLNDINEGRGFFGMQEGGVVPELQYIDQIAQQQFGLRLGSGHRSEQGSFHNTGEARDYGSAGQEEQMLAFAKYMYNTFGSQLAELIFDHPQMPQLIDEGQPVDPSVFGGEDHWDHVHVAVRSAAQPGGVGNQQIPGASALAGGGASGISPMAGGAGGAFSTPFAQGGGNLSPEAQMELAEEQEARAEAIENAERQQRNANEAVQDAIYARDEALRQLEEARAGGVDEFGNPTAADPEQIRQLERQVSQAERNVRDATEGAADAEEGLADARQEATKPSDVLTRQQKEMNQTRPDSNAQSLGGGLVTGMLEALGFDGSVFGDPTQWGIWKLFTGGVNYAGNLMKNFGEAHGGGAAGGAGGGGAPFGLLSGLLSGAGIQAPEGLVSSPAAVTQGHGLSVPSAVSATAQPGSAVAPAGSPASGAGAGMPPGPVIDQSVTFNGQVGQAAPDVAAAIEKGRQAVNRQPQVGFPGGVPHP